MTTKLTLSIDTEVIEKAKEVSRRKGKSLSRLVEEHLKALVQSVNEKPSYVKSMSGALKGKLNTEVSVKDAKENIYPQNMAYKIFVDTNVYLDVLMQRGSNWQYAESLLLLAEQKRLSAYTSASNILNLIYILHTEKIAKSVAIYHSTNILRFCTLANPDNRTFEMALNASFTDLEDAVQYYTAMNIPGIDYFITSNTKDFKKALASLPVVSAKDFMQLWENGLKKNIVVL